MEEKLANKIIKAKIGREGLVWVSWVFVHGIGDHLGLYLKERREKVYRRVLWGDLDRVR